MTGKQFEKLLADSRGRKMTPEEREEQIVNWVIGQTFDVFNGPPSTPAEIRETLGLRPPAEFRK
jgi:hypothetical protein